LSTKRVVGQPPPGGKIRQQEAGIGSGRGNQRGNQVPPSRASADVTFRYWRPPVAGRQAILVGFGQGKASGFCSGYTLLGRIEMPTANRERGLPIARCTLDSSLTAGSPGILRATGA